MYSFQQKKQLLCEGENNVKHTMWSTYGGISLGAAIGFLIPSGEIVWFKTGIVCLAVSVLCFFIRFRMSRLP